MGLRRFLDNKLPVRTGLADALTDVTGKSRQMPLQSGALLSEVALEEGQTSFSLLAGQQLMTPAWYSDNRNTMP